MNLQVGIYICVFALGFFVSAMVFTLIEGDTRTAFTAAALAVAFVTFLAGIIFLRERQKQLGIRKPQ